jgi:hypothetical protein
LRIEGYNSNTTDTSGDFETIELIEDSKDEEKNLYEGEDLNLFIKNSYNELD